MTEKPTHVTQGYSHEILSYHLCLHYRIANYLQNKSQKSSVTVKSKRKCKKTYDGFWICERQQPFLCGHHNTLR